MITTVNGHFVLDEEVRARLLRQANGMYWRAGVRRPVVSLATLIDHLEDFRLYPSQHRLELLARLNFRCGRIHCHSLLLGIRFVSIHRNDYTFSLFYQDVLKLFYNVRALENKFGCSGRAGARAC